ncbi:MAG: non-ribosomal peptide synthetase [unclassified Hahellaceae]|nr:non-ribosomal peptide synthetase [Hahellaceae bacterium]|tara:strand:+ start:123721 stop:138033 length:14313 start_codon:yes stop_codon:yes gene_type:complete
MSAQTAQNIEDVYPLSPLQQGMLFHTLLHSESGVYLMQDRYRIGGHLDTDAFLEGWRLVVAAHPALRTSFLWKSQKQPLQAVHKQIADPVEFIDLSELSAEQQDAHIKALLALEQKQGFNLAKPPLIRIRLVRLGPEDYEMIRSFHHILMDAWCISLVMVDFVDAYDALRQGRQPDMRQPRPYRDYIAWLQQQDKSIAEGFWRQQLAGLDAPTPLVVEQAARQNQYQEAVLVDDMLVRLDEPQTQALMRFCQDSRITPNTLFQGVWALLLSRYSGNADVVFGVTVSGRPPELAGVEEMIGLFINTLPLRIQVDEAEQLVPWLQSLQSLNLDLREFEHSSLVDIQGWSDFVRGEEIFDSILVYENAPIDAKLLGGELSFRLEDMDHSVHTHYGLTVVILPETRLGIRISYDRRRFARDSIERMLGHVRQLVLNMVAGPTKALGSLELLTSIEREQLLIGWNQTSHDFPLDKTYAALFAEQVATRPQAVAAVCGAERFTYAELDARASRLAAALLASGAGPDTLVAVLTERGLGFLTSLIAIFKAGAAYLPLEVKHPQQRLAEILRLSQTTLVLTNTAQAALADKVCAQLDTLPQVLEIERFWQHGPVPDIALQGRPQDLAYAIFTSGSTGTPKGALVEQLGMLNNIFGKVPSLGLSTDARIAQTASVAFDISVWQFLAAPVLGATVHILPDEVSQDPALLLDALEQQGLTVLEAVPAVIRGLLTASTTTTELASLRWLLPTGEALPPALCQDWFARFPNIPMMNAYGPAECSDDVAFYAITEAPESQHDERAQAMPIGRPTANNELFILDAAMRPVPVGVPGEICVAGVGVGRGYLHDSERTRMAFVPHPFVKGARFYRTGDLGQYRSDGVIEFLGRRDQQVKIRGHRIELGEIETRLQHEASVREAAVIARPDGRGEQQLVAYWCRHTGHDTNLTTLREHLARQLPPYMLPSRFIELDRLPLNANGKIDRKLLTQRELAQSEDIRVLIQPRNETEQTLYGIWSEILAVDTFSVDDGFFELGGHSLLATQMISRIRAAFKTELPLKALFEHPTLASLARLLEQETAQQNERQSDQGAVLAAIQPQPRPSRLPLSFAQQRLWFIEQLNPGSSQFNIPFAMKLVGQLNRSALQQSFEALVVRHEVLRTAFLSEKGEAYQEVLSEVECPLPLVDLTEVLAADRDQVVQAQLTEWFEQPFNLARPPLLRAQLLQLGAQEHILAVTLHHLVSDAWSATIAMRELAERYGALQDGTAKDTTAVMAPLPIQYADFALWQRQHLQGDVLERQLDYWKQALAPSDGEASEYLLTLPMDKPRPAVQSYESGTLTTQLSPALSERIRAFATTQGQSPFSLVFAAFAVLLHRMSGQSDILMGTPMSNRSRPETEPLLGILLNNLAIRADFSAKPSFTTVARQISEGLLAAQAHQDLPFEQLVDHLALPRSLSHAPLFQVMVAQQLTLERRIQFPELSFEVLETTLTHSEYDLDLHIITPADSPVELELMYAKDLFERSTAEGWLERFETLLETLLETPEKPVAELPLLTAREWQQTIVEWNRTSRPYARDLTVHEAFEQQVARTPDAMAIVFEDQQLSYGELNGKANRLAHYLRSQGLPKEALVALCVDRSLDIFIGIIGILKAGAAYVPLDPTYPAERLAHMLEDAKPAALLTQQHLLETLPAQSAPVFCLDSDWHRLADEPDSNPVNQTQPDELAYVIYTSGSTGRPKGTLIYHRGVLNLLTARLGGIYRPLGVAQMRASFNYSYAFDASVAEFILLLDGHTLHIVPDDVRFSPLALVQFFKETRLDTFECTPPQLKFLIESGETADLPRFVLFGGDAIDAQLWQRLHSIENTVFFNTYGPTECTVDAVACRITPSLQKPVIGRPIANMKAYVLDDHLNPLPVGVAGELHIGGEGVGYGYMNRPELTAEKFITDPFSNVPAARMYKSGDLVRFLADGNIEYLGRIDHQVKIRGFRVELGEIEAAMAALPAVQEVVVVVREDRPGDKRLVAYFVADSADSTAVADRLAPDVDQLRLALKAQLPEYMIPAQFVVLDTLPLTDNGKINRRALPPPQWQDQQAAIEPPRNEVERRLVQIWSEVLHVPEAQVGRDSNFFHLGGHSLLATVLFARIGQNFERTPALRQLFEAPTIEGLAPLVGTLRSPDADIFSSISDIATKPRPERLPLSFAQLRLWFLEQLNPGSGEYNITTAVVFEGDLQLEWLRQALETVVHRHDILRSRITPEITGAALSIRSPESFVLPLNVVSVSDAEWPAYMQQAAEHEARTGFDLSHDSLVRASLLQQAASRQTLLLLTLHHTVADDWSTQLLIEEVAEVYQAHAQQREAQLVALPVQYTDFALWQHEPAQQALYRRQLEYWKQTLEDGDYALDLPTDKPRSPQLDSTAGTCFAQLPHDLTTQLRHYAQAHNVTTYMVLMAALKILLGRYSNQRDVRIGTPVANRSPAEIQHLIGCFVNTLVVRSELAPDLAFDSFLTQVKQQVLSAQEHQDVPFEQVVEALAPERELGRTPLFQVLFVMQNAGMSVAAWPELSVRELAFASPAAKFDLNWEVHDDQTTLSVMLEYRASLFKDSTMQRWLDEWQQLLRDIVARPAAMLRELSPLTEAGREQQLTAWNNTTTHYPGPQTLSHALLAQAEQTPDATALVFESTRLSYQALHERANQLAHALRERGVGRESIVGVCMTRSVEMVVALLGIIRAGGAYLPLDPELPASRLQFMLEDASASLVLTQNALRSQLPETCPAISLDDPAFERGTAKSPAPLNEPSDLAYVIYTSGSTGQPKGVLTEHAALMNRLQWMQATFPIDGDDRILQKTPYSFDVSVWEFFWPLITGACLVVARPGGHQDSGYLVETIQREGISTLHFVPSMLEAFMEEPGLADCTTLRQVFASGEALPFELQQRFFARHSADLLNLYGPTEAAIDVSWWRCDRETRLGSVPIGRPIANTQLYILDDDRQLLPIGAIGELYIGGVGLARGYLNRAELTAKRFVDNPFEPGSRLYRTGDRCRFMADGAISGGISGAISGAIEYMGRVDHQVKLRGLRIELGEIDAALLKQTGVKAAVTVLHEAPRDEKRSPQLVAYVVADALTGDPAPLDLEQIRLALAAALPAYMVPTHLLELPRLPLSRNGKIDRKQLPPPVLDEHTQHGAELIAAPLGSTETALAQLWSEVLNLPLDSIGRRSHFFRLGGHSLLATVLLAKMRQQFTSTPSLRQLFEKPVLAELATLTGASRTRQASGLVRQPRPERLPLSFAQQRLWFLEQLETDSAEYNITSAVEFSGNLQLDWLRQALEQIVARHEILRSRIIEQGDGAELIIDSSSALPLSLESIDADDETWSQLMTDAANQEASRPFDLARDRLIRVRALQRSGSLQTLLLLTLHHAVADDWSMQILISELSVLYSARAQDASAQLPELPVQYVDYSLWQRDIAQAEHYRLELDYWKRVLEDGGYVLELPTDYPRQAEMDTASGSHAFTLPPQLTQQLRRFANEQDASVYMIVLAVTQVLLGRLANQRDVRLGTAVANRGLLETQSLIGCFVNTLVIRTELDPLAAFPAFLGQVKERVLEAQAHQDLPFEQLVDAVATERDFTQTPLFQVMLTMQNTSLETTSWPELSLREIPAQSAAAQFDLDWDIHDDQHDISVRVSYRKALFEDATIARWLDLWQRLLSQVLEPTTRPVGELALVSPVEQRQLLIEWNRSEADFPLDRTYAQLFAERVAAHPERIAAVCGQASLSYRELDERASRIAGALLEAGAKPDTLVALLAERGLPLLTMMVAVFKAGAAYLPLDVNHPAQRLRDVLKQSQAPVLLTACAGSDAVGAVLDEVLTGLEAMPVVLNAESLWEHGPVPVLRDTGSPQDLAYVIFTSGSTGTPKGAMVEQAGMINNIYGKVPSLGLTAADRIAQTASPAFDISVWQFLAAPILGATVHILPDDIARDPGALLAAMEAESLSILEVVPTVIRGLLDSATADTSLQSLRWLLPTGEALPPDLCQAWFGRFPEVPMMNAYGPAECSDDVAFHPIFEAPEASGGAMPVGRPTANNQLYILDPELQLVPVGVPGEICVAGVGVGRGYLNDPERSRQAFVTHPFEPGARFYRTGDIGRYRQDGVIEFLGRRDQQVKVRGHRIELGEVEARLLAHDAVADAVVIARRDQRGENQLVAYWVTADQQIDVGAIKDALAAQLPYYMVPTAFVKLDRLPLNANGKVDRKALTQRELDWTDESRAITAPRTETEHTLCELLCGLLKLEQVSVDDNFFALGGDSILGLQLIARAKARGVALTPKQLFQQRTIADLAMVAGSTDQIQAEQGVLAGDLPLLPIQHWLFEQNAAEPAYWNQSLLLTPRESLSYSTLRETLQALITHHDALRMRFVQDQRGWHQYYAGIEGAFALGQLQVASIDQLPEALQPFAASLDLHQGPLLRAVLVDLPAGQQRLYLAIHHLVIDTVSWRILLEDFNQLYSQLSRNEAPSLPAKTSSYRQWAQGLNRHAESAALAAERDFWTTQGQDSAMPVDHPEKPNLSTDEVTLIEKLTAEETRQLLQETQKAYRTQVPELLLTALSQTLCEWKSDRALTVALEGHGRESLFPELDLSRTVGWFTSLYQVCLRLPESVDAGACIKAVKEQLRAVPQHGLGYGVLRYLAREALPAPTSGVLFNYLGRVDDGQEAGFFDISSDPVPADRSGANAHIHELEIVPMILNDSLQVEWRFSGQRYDIATQAQLLTRYMAALRALISHCVNPEAGGFTPSDFPLAKKLNQKSLDKLLGKLSTAQPSTSK